MHFDSKRRQFSFKNRFESLEDMMAKMYEEKMGVAENEYLWDDLYKYKAEIQQKREAKEVFRVVNTESKPRKPPQYVLFVKGYKGDVIDAQGLEKLSSPFLRNHWLKAQDYSGDNVLASRAFGDLATDRQASDQNNQNGGKKSKGRDQREARFDARGRLANEHLRFQIERAAKEIVDMTILKTKSGFKRVKS